MRKCSYEKRMDKSITEVKMYVILLSIESSKQYIHDIVNHSTDIRQLRNKINRRKDIALTIFMAMKKALDNTDSFDVLEEHLTYMNLIFDSLFPPVTSYKHQLFQHIVTNYNFTVDTYCILRHLITFREDELANFITYMSKHSLKSEDEFHYLATEIFCIEHMYDDAYDHLYTISFDEHLEQYREELYEYSSYKYRKIIEHRRNPVLQLIFDR